MNRRGYTLIENMLVLSMVATLTGFALPKVQTVLMRESVKGARREVVTQLARAKGAAASRGCTSVLHVVGGANARVWVTSCALSGAGIDTVGMVDYLSDRFEVDVALSGDSISFSPAGMGRAASPLTLTFSKGDKWETLTVSRVGRTSW